MLLILAACSSNTVKIYPYDENRTDELKNVYGLLNKGLPKPGSESAKHLPKASLLNERNLYLSAMTEPRKGRYNQGELKSGTDYWNAPYNSDTEINGSEYDSVNQLAIMWSTFNAMIHESKMFQGEKFREVYDDTENVYRKVNYYFSTVNPWTTKAVKGDYGYLTQYKAAYHFRTLHLPQIAMFRPRLIPHNVNRRTVLPLKGFHQQTKKKLLENPYVRFGEFRKSNVAGQTERIPGPNTKVPPLVSDKCIPYGWKPSTQYYFVRPIYGSYFHSEALFCYWSDIAFNNVIEITTRYISGTPEYGGFSMVNFVQHSNFSIDDEARLYSKPARFVEQPITYEGRIDQLPAIYHEIAKTRKLQRAKQAEKIALKLHRYYMGMFDLAYTATHESEEEIVQQYLKQCIPAGQCSAQDFEKNFDIKLAIHVIIGNTIFRTDRSQDILKESFVRKAFKDLNFPKELPDNELEGYKFNYPEFRPTYDYKDVHNNFRYTYRKVRDKRRFLINGCYYHYKDLDQISLLQGKLEPHKNAVCTYDEKREAEAWRDYYEPPTFKFRNPHGFFTTKTKKQHYMHGGTEKARRVYFYLTEYARQAECLEQYRAFPRFSQEPDLLIDFLLSKPLAFYEENNANMSFCLNGKFSKLVIDEFKKTSGE